MFSMCGSVEHKGEKTLKCKYFSAPISTPMAIWPTKRAPRALLNFRNYNE
jgi:hypothetical protein